MTDTGSNFSGILRSVNEERLLSGLTDRLQAREPVAEATRSHAEDINRKRRASDASDRKAQADFEKKIMARISITEHGSYVPGTWYGQPDTLVEIDRNN